MRAGLYFFSVTACAALPIESVPLALAAPERVEASSPERSVPGAARFLTLGGGSLVAIAMEDLVDQLSGALPMTLFEAGRTDLMILDGRVLKAARVVAASETTVTIDHAEALTEVPVEMVPLDVLARARAEIAAIELEKKRREAEIVAQVAARIREQEERKVAEFQGRLAVASTGSDGQVVDLSEATKPPVLTPSERLVALKKKFPARKRGKNALGIEFDLPPRQVWSFYYSSFQAATMGTLRETIATMEARLTRDIETWQWRSKSTESMSQSVESLQAQQTYAWLSHSLNGFLQEARRLTWEK